jgi:phosphinothricin acetyltransferase
MKYADTSCQSGYRDGLFQTFQLSVRNDSDTPQPDELRQRRKNLKDRRFPHVVAIEGEIGRGICLCGVVPQTPGLRYTVKHSIYVHHDHIGQGIGSLLMRGLIDACAAAGMRQMIGYIAADNVASLALHERFGFVRVGLLPGVAYRYDRWADSVMVQRSLASGSTTPPPPPPISTR